MAPMEQDYPSEISLPVPAVYRRYLLGKRILASLFGMVIIILGIVFVPYITSHPHRTPPYFMFYFCLIFLVSEISDEIRGWKQTRLFTINRKFMTIPSAYLRAWRQQCVTWFTDAIVSVERFEWHGLPALQIVVEGKRRKTVVTVFREEDRATVETQIIPLIETYRHRHRSKVLASMLQTQ